MKIYNLSALAALLINASISSLFCYPLVMLPRYPCLATRALDFPLRGIVTTIQVKTKKFGEIKQKVYNSKDILDRWLKTCNCAIKLFFVSNVARIVCWKFVIDGKQGFWLKMISSTIHESQIYHKVGIIGKQMFQNE